MAQITVTIPDAVLPRVLDAFAVRYGWNAAGGQTKAQFAKAKLIDFTRDVVRLHETATAAETARSAASAGVDTDIVLT